METVFGASPVPFAPKAQTSGKWAPGTSRPLSDEDRKTWDAALERGERVAKQFHPQWERGLKRYAKAINSKAPEDINALLDYRHVESKKSHLFHRTPDMTLTPIDPLDQTIPFRELLPLRQKFLNHELGPKGANAKRALHKTLVETLASSGLMITVVGYEDVKLPVPPDPLTGEMPIDANGQPVTSVTVWSRRFISPISGMKLIVPDNFRDSSDFDSAPWLAYKGCMPVAQAKRQGWNLPPDFVGTAQKDDAVYKHVDGDGGASDAEAEYTIVWYRASLYDATVFNPELYRCLILVKGLEEPAWHVDSPYQAITPEGQLTDDSLVGNPIHVGTLRDMPDCAFPPSDVVVGEQLSVELNQFRTDLIRGRRARRPGLAISDALGQPNIEKITKNEGPIVLPEDQFDGAGNLRGVAIIGKASEPRDNYTAQEIIEHDYDEALGQDANRRGTTAKKKTTATEARIVQGNSSARSETEQDRIRDYFIALARKFDVIVQRTATQQDVAKVLGQQGAMLWEQWKLLPGRYAYDILPDSGRYVDIHEARSEWLQKYTLLRKDERVNTEELLEEGARLWNRDPAKFIAPPVDKTTEPPSAAVSFKGDDTLNPAMGNLLLDFCANAGIKLRPETIAAFAAQHQAALLLGQGGAPAIGMNSNPDEHGGSATETEPVNKHQMERTGKMQGMVQ